MKRLHLALSTDNVQATIVDYSRRLGVTPCVTIADEYALWRTETLNVSVRYDPSCATGRLRHLGWEDAAAADFSVESDVNGVVWEHFSAEQQAKEINDTWPGTNYIAAETARNSNI